METFVFSFFLREFRFDYFDALIIYLEEYSPWIKDLDCLEG
jgi:hypothetical protein